MLDNLDLKCALGNAIVAVLIYLLITEKIFKGTGGKLSNVEHWYQSSEFMIFVSVLIGYGINTSVFKLCKA